MKLVVMCLIGIVAYVTPTLAEQTVTRGVIYLCAAEGSISRGCTPAGAEVQGREIWECPVRCGEGFRPGDLHSYEPSVVFGDANSTLPQDWDDEVQVRTRIIPDGPSTRAGSIWTPSPAEMFIKRSIGIANRAVGVPSR